MFIEATYIVFADAYTVWASARTVTASPEVDWSGSIERKRKLFDAQPPLCGLGLLIKLSQELFTPSKRQVFTGKIFAMFRFFIHLEAKWGQAPIQSLPAS